MNIAWNWRLVLMLTVPPMLWAGNTVLTPLLTAVLSAAMLGEAPQAYHAIAFALIVAGIGVSALKRRSLSPGLGSTSKRP